MRNLIVWTLSFLLGFEPALMAQGNANQAADVKAFLELTGLGKRSVTVREVYNKVSPYLPKHSKDTLLDLAQKYGDVVIPKMDISKIKSGSDEIYKLQVVKNGQSATFEVTGDGKQFAKLNGQALSYADMTRVNAVMQKAGLPADIAANEFRPQIRPPEMLDANDFGKLKKKDQAAYIKQLRELMVSMEKVQTWSLAPKKTASSETASKFDVIARLLRGEEAQALKVGDKCVAAGYVATVARSGSGRLMCATDGQDGIPEDFRRLPDGSSCSTNQFACNGAIFGSGQDGHGICVKAGSDTTAKCSELAQTGGNDIPDLTTAKNKTEFMAVMSKVKEASLAVLNTCDATKANYSGDNSKNPAKGLIEDQKSTCSAFEARWAKIQSWDCESNPDFKKNYEKLCKDKEEAQRPPPAPPAGGAPGGGADNQEGPPGVASGTGGVPGQAPVTDANRPVPGKPSDGIFSCDKDPMPKQYSLSSACEGGAEGRAMDSVKCRDNSGNIITGESGKIYECRCYEKNGDQEKTVAPAERNKCKTGAGSLADKAGKAAKETKSWLSRNSKWLIPLALGLTGLFLFHWMAKKAVKQSYEYLEPVPQNPPVAPVTAPVPRGTN